MNEKTKEDHISEPLTAEDLQYINTPFTTADLRYIKKSLGTTPDSHNHHARNKSSGGIIHEKEEKQKK